MFIRRQMSLSQKSILYYLTYYYHMALHMVVSYDLKKGRKLVSIVFSKEETELIDKWISFNKAWFNNCLKIRVVCKYLLSMYRKYIKLYKAFTQKLIWKQWEHIIGIVSLHIITYK